MGLLEELRAEAESKRRDEEEKDKASAKDRVDVRPRMEAIAAYLRELAEHLNYLEVKIYAEYEIDQFGLVDKLLQHDYHIGEFQDAMRSFSLSFICSSNRTYKVHLRHLEDIERLREYLRIHGLNSCRVQEFHAEQHRLEEARFFFTPHLDVVILFEARPDTSSIELIGSNFFSIGTERLKFRAKNVDESFLEELGKSILRRENRLMEYQRFYLSDDQRDRIRAKIRAEEMQREVEARVSDRNQTFGAPEGRAAFTRIVKRLLGDLAGSR